MSDDALSRLNAALEGRYEIESRLGEGGMATVYLADDLKHHRKVAVKVLKSELAAVVGAERFLAEIETTAGLQHPHILPLFDSGEAGGFLYYVMPYVEGESLGQRLARERQLPVDEAVRIATDLAEALDYAHRHGVIHRDIKPANIMMHEGRPLIADFGIALAVGAAGGTRLTETGLSVGTPYYMSPEQATGDSVVGPQSDIYSVGCVLFEMLTGDPPYPGSTAQAVLGKIIQGTPVSATEIRATVPTNVDAAIRRCLEKLPADRFPTGGELAKALADPAFRHGVVAAGPAPGAGGVWNRLSVATTAVAGVFAVAFLWAVTRPGPPAPAEPVSRFSVIIRPDQGPNPAFAIAPDGSAVVFEAPDASGNLQLWVRPLNSFTPSPVPGTEGNTNTLAISDDGREVAFTSGGQLKVAPLQGGVVRTLADSVVCCERWGPDGFIYYSSVERTIWRVPSGGGAKEPVTKRDQEGDGPHGDFQVLPGGDVAVFTVWGQPTRIEAMRLSTGERKVLAPGVKPYYTPTGDVVFASLAGELLAAPFDPETLELTGSPVPLLDGVLVTSLDYPEYSLSQTGTVVYWTGKAATNRREFVWVTRAGVATPVDPGWTFDRGDTNAGWSLSPDGTRLALRALTESGYDIWIKELDNGPYSRLTFNESQERMPRWAPDGETVTFLSDRDGKIDVWAKRADGASASERIYEFDRDVAQGFWAPGGKWMILRVAGPMGGVGGRDILGVRPGVDSIPVPLVAGEYDEAAPAVSPDGRWLAYNSNETGRYEVFVRPFPDVGSGKWQVSTNGGKGPLWAHNGRELFFVDDDDQMVDAHIETKPAFRVLRREALFTMPSTFEGRGPNAYITGLYDIAPDDQRFLMARVFQDEKAQVPNELMVVQNWFEELKARVGGAQPGG